MDEFTLAFVTYLLREHERCGFETDFDRLAHALRIRVCQTDFESWAASGPPRVITLSRHLYGNRKRFTGHHEIAHLLLAESGVEDALVTHYGGVEAADARIEELCNYGAGLLLIPDRMLGRALHEYGGAPGAVYGLYREHRASLEVSLRRVVHAELEGQAVGFVTSGSYIYDVAARNCKAPFLRYDRVPEVAQAVPAASLLALTPRRVVGVVAW